MLSDGWRICRTPANRRPGADSLRELLKTSRPACYRARFSGDDFIGPTQSRERQRAGPEAQSNWRGRLLTGDLSGHVREYVAHHGQGRDILSKILQIDLVERVRFRVMPIEVVRAGGSFAQAWHAVAH
jgi:hypothetical protein